VISLGSPSVDALPFQLGPALVSVGGTSRIMEIQPGPSPDTPSPVMQITRATFVANAAGVYVDVALTCGNEPSFLGDITVTISQTENTTVNTRTGVVSQNFCDSEPRTITVVVAGGQFDEGTAVVSAVAELCPPEGLTTTFGCPSRVSHVIELANGTATDPTSPVLAISSATLLGTGDGVDVQAELLCSSFTSDGGVDIRVYQRSGDLIQIGTAGVRVEELPCMDQPEAMHIVTTGGSFQPGPALVTGQALICEGDECSITQIGHVVQLG